MTQHELITAFDQLGRDLTMLENSNPMIERAHLENKWFTPESQLLAIRHWAALLQSDILVQWLSEYSYSHNPKNIGIVMAGNIPLVGLHDLICVLAAGHHAHLKLSSDDNVLMKWIIAQLIKINYNFKEKILVVEKLNTCEALIATGSDNTSRYFNFYFKSVPKIIRKNRSSLAIITGKESTMELSALADDIFLYFGLGCRNVSKLMVPENYNFNSFFESIERYHELKNHNKYFNNYTYHKAILLMNMTPHLDNGFLLVKEDERLGSPLGCLFYSYYKERNEIIEYIDARRESIQVIVGNPDFIHESIPFGKSQYPGLKEYSDDMDTMSFLNKL